MRAVEMLQHTIEIVGGDRQETHGPKLRNFDNIARGWSALLTTILGVEVKLTASNVCDLMEEMKISRRYSGKFNADDYIDSAGYSACSIECIVSATRVAAASKIAMETVLTAPAETAEPRPDPEFNADDIVQAVVKMPEAKLVPVGSVAATAKVEDLAVALKDATAADETPPRAAARKKKA